MKLLQKQFLLLLSMVAIISMLFVNQSIVSAKTQTQVVPENWTLYTDARFNYSFEYPVGWGIKYRNDESGMYGEPLLVYPDGENNNAFGIYVGNYLTKIQNSESLLEWTNQYNQLLDTFDLGSHEVTSVTIADINDKEGVEVILDVARYTNVRVGDIVWFVWANIDQSTDPEYTTAYEHVVSTLVFAASSLMSLSEINGTDVNGQSLEEVAEINAMSISSEISTLAIASFRLPFVGFHYVTLGPGCPPTHLGISGEAIDYGLYIGDEVLPGESGKVMFAGWNTYGYGNLVKIDHGGGYISYYGHLNHINVSVGATVDKGWTTLGQSGNTGNSSGPHLHFEVQKDGNAYSIRNMAGQTLYSPTCDSSRQYDGTATGTSKEPPGSNTSFKKISPQNGITIPSSNSLYLLQWENNGLDWFQYCIDETNNNSCNSSWIRRKSYSGPDEFTLVAGHTYYWQVKREDNGSEADNGTWWSFTVKLNYPTVTSIVRDLPTSSTTNVSSVSFAATFSQPVTGVDINDFSLTTTGDIVGANVSGVSGSAANYVVTVNTGSGDGTIRLNVVDNDSIKNVNLIPLGGSGLGNGSFSDGEVYTVDKTPSIFSITSGGTNPANTATVNFIVTFSINVTGVDVSDFALTTGSGISGVTISEVNGFGAIYIVTVNTGSGDGTIRLDAIDNDSIVDDANNPLGGSGVGTGDFNTGEIYEIDKTSPTPLSIVRFSANPSSAYTVIFTVTFSEPVIGVNADDFVLTTTGVYGWIYTIQDVGSIPGLMYYVWVTTGNYVDGTIRLDLVDNDSITDLSLNPLGGLGTGNGDFNTGEAYIIDKNPLPAPYLRSPENNLLTNNNLPTFLWGPVRGALYYEIMIATDQLFTNIARSEFVNGDSYIPTPPIEDGKFYWRVRAYDSVDQPGYWSSVRILTIDTTPPSAPVLWSPADNSTLSGSPTLRWLGDATADSLHQGYHLQVDDNADFLSPIVSTKTSSPRILPTLPSGTYYWRVRARDVVGNWGVWSTYFTFNIVR